MRAVIRHMAAEFRADTINLMCLHTHLDGAVFTGSERRVHLGDDWAATPQALPANAHYVALGHIHKPQKVQAPSPAQYAGSPLQMDFGEVGEEKSFVVLDAEPGRPARVERVPYEGGKSLHHVRATYAELEAQQEDLRDRGYLRVVVPLEEPDADVNRKVRKLLPDAVSVDVELPAPSNGGPARLSLRDHAPREVFAGYYQDRYGTTPEPRVLEAFDELYHEAGGQE
jgi:exonuclease SbcD